VFKKSVETTKLAPSDPAGFRKNRPNSVKTGRNPFDLKFEQWNPQLADFADKLAEWTVNSAWIVNSVEHVWMNLNRFDES
jgi:hypothetical protein